MIWHDGGSECGYSMVVGSGILICVGVGFGLVGGGGMVGVVLKAHLLRLATLNFEAIHCTKTHFWWWFLWWWCGVWVWVLDLL